MHIKIAERLQPFCRISGTWIYLPGTTLGVRVYPAKVVVFELGGEEAKKVQEWEIPLSNGLEDFTVMQNIEKACVSVWGKSGKDYLRYHIKGEGGSAVILPEKGNLPFPLVDKKWLIGKFERLSLGSHKKQEWDLVRRRNDLKEILPIWLALGQQMTGQVVQGEDSLLAECSRVVKEGNAADVYGALSALFQAGFNGLMTPRASDEDFLGYKFPLLSQGTSPLALLSEGARLIRCLLFTEQGDHAHILPLLPPQFHCGRMVGIQWNGELDIEWSKKRMRRMVFCPKNDAVVLFHFPKDVRTFRLWQTDRLHPIAKQCGEELEVKAGVRYCLDHFEH